MDVLLEGVVGSQAYGLAGPGSDVDRLGVYLAPTRTVLGVTGPAAVAASRVSTHPDVTHHELGKYVSLALRANPTVLELLFLTRYEVCTPAGAALVAARDAFLSAPAVRAAYGGYAVQQARRLRARHAEGRAVFSSDLAKRTAKHGRHCLRLLVMAAQLLEHGTLEVDVSAHRDELFAAGELAVSDPDAFAALFEDRLAALDARPSVLPERPDVARVDALVVAIRIDALDRDR